jgi:hypothetical protein
MTKYIFTGLIFFLFTLNIFAEPREWKSNPFSKAFLNLEGSEVDAQGSLSQGSIFSGSTSSQGLKLQGIWKTPTAYKAMINDTILAIGQDINGYKIKNIVANKVFLESIESGASMNLEIKE